jgi:hypothetical protein
VSGHFAFGVAEATFFLVRNVPSRGGLESFSHFTQRFAFSSALGNTEPPRQGLLFVGLYRRREPNLRAFAHSEAELQR